MTPIATQYAKTVTARANRIILRGFGATRFRSMEIMRSGQLSALGQDLLDLADALGLQHFAVVGHDWGARAAYIASRCVSKVDMHNVTH